MNFKRQKSFSLKGIDKGHHKITYRGVPCIKCPFDYVLYQMIINQIQPDLIIEIGTNFGGSAVYMADMLGIIGKGVVHTIDIDDKAFDVVKTHSRIKLFTKGWKNYDTSFAKQYSKVLVIEDSSHQYKNTIDALHTFASLVTKGSYLIVEDGIIDELGLSKQFNGGPVKAIKEFIKSHPEFIIDYGLINFFGESATFNTMGYLKRSL
jgi:cephalosporin hydroxylase